MPSVLNISAYLFTFVDDPHATRALLLPRADAAALKGTILVAGEGINLFLAGEATALRGFIEELQADPRFGALRTRESWSDEQPFRRLEVKVKGEIIRMNRPAVRPGDGRAPSVAPATVQRWLDQGADDDGRRVVMLDTRNGFEVDLGTFRGAVDWRLERFSQFPDAAEQHRDSLAGATVVTFCTGGIRCEKAALQLSEIGISAVQLDGGILGYFDEVGGAHWSGECFVFDERETLTPPSSPAGVVAG